MMKSYKERLPEIDKAIFDLDGDINNAENGRCNHDQYPYLAKAYSFLGYILVGRNSVRDIKGDYLATRKEWDYRLCDYMELYRWSAERNQLVREILFKEFLKRDNGSLARAWAREAEKLGFNWQLSVDPIGYAMELDNWRYMQKENHHEVIDYYRKNYDWKYNNDGSCTLSPKSDKQKSNWFERGELPPVGEKVVRAHNGDTVKVLANGTAGVICVIDEEDYLYLLASCDNDFLPLKTERDELIDKAAGIMRGTDIGLTAAYQSVLCRALYDAGMLKMPEGK